MTTLNQGRWALVLLAFIIIFLQGCKQEEPRPESTAVSVLTPNPTSVVSAFDPGIAAVSSPTPLPIPAAPVPTATPSVQPSPQATPQESGEVTIGFSVQNRPVAAYPAGSGKIKIAVIGGGEQAYLWAAHYRSSPDMIPPDMTLWFVPNPNPDNIDPNSPFNANGVNVYQNADSRFTPCPEQSNDPATRGPYPFSEPESRALRDFLADSWVVVWLTAGSDPIKPGACGERPAANALASFLAGESGQVPGGSALMKGHFVDYLVGEGTAAAVMGQAGMRTAVLDALMKNVEQVMAAETVSANGSFQWVDASNSGEWQFPVDTFVHPLAVEMIGQSVYILDGGQVQRLNRQAPAAPEVILAPGDDVAGVRVIEPLDIATDGQTLLVLDRAGDVYGLEPETGQWLLRRYDRPVGETSSHYYVALASQPGEPSRNFLLEGSYHFALDQGTGRPDFIWPLPEYHQVDIAVNHSDVYVLSQSPISTTASLVHYQDGARDNEFFPGTDIYRPRQVQAVGSVVYVLNYGGRRLTAFNTDTGQINTVYRPADGKAWRAFMVNEISGEILLAGRDRVFFFGAPAAKVVVPGTDSQLSPQINDPQVLESLRGLLMPIGGSDITLRENQMPGAPRHYRYGVHEGADFYWQSGTPARAAAPGTVIRATVEYEIPSPEMFGSWGYTVEMLGYTSAEAHDFYRGMQIWIEHEGGFITRYVHLSAIEERIWEGAAVEAGQIIGAVGNTGSPVSLEGPETDAHLHFELWLGEHYLGQFLRPIEIREWLAAILNEQ